MARKRSTRQKEILLKEIARLDTFFTAEELHGMVKKHDIGIATVYRLLAGMTRDHALYSYQCDRRTVYSKDNTSHCHFVCEKTGKITHFRIDSLDFLKDKIPGSIKSFQIEVRGECKGNCSKW